MKPLPNKSADFAQKTSSPMKNFSLTMTILFAGCGLAIAQEPTKGRIYIGAAKDAPAWVWEVPKASAYTNQIAANDSWVRWLESGFAQQRAVAQKAMLRAEAARADYVADPRNRMLKPEAGGAQLTRERGIILDYNPNTLLGVMSGEDGKRWLFRAADWPEPRDDPKRGLWVDFVPEAETGYALFVYSLGPFRAKHLELESPR
jgi:hypothetical protein